MKNIKNLFSKAKSEAGKTATKMITNGSVTNEFNQDNLRKMSKMYVRTIGIAPAFMPQARSKIITAIEDDINSMLKSGKTKEEVQAFYWEVAEFQKLWEVLKLKLEDLQNIINNCEIILNNKGESC